MPEHLELREHQGRGAYFLDDLPLAHGEAVDVLFLGGLWLQGSFSWSGFSIDKPQIHADLGGKWEARARDSLGVPFVVFSLPPEASLRRPLPAGSKAL